MPKAVIFSALRLAVIHRHEQTVSVRHPDRMTDGKSLVRTEISSWKQKIKKTATLPHVYTAGGVIKGQAWIGEGAGAPKAWPDTPIMDCIREATVVNGNRTETTSSEKTIKAVENKKRYLSPARKMNGCVADGMIGSGVESARLWRHVCLSDSVPKNHHGCRK